ncbi:MAG: hypothetical protein ACOC1U_04545 [Spirochaetota bacterium]
MTADQVSRHVRHRWYVTLPAAVGLGLLNAGADFINDLTLEIPLFLDSIGTMIAAAVFGLVPGVVAAVSTHLAMEFLNGWAGAHFPWVVCSLSSAAIVWYLTKSGRFQTLVDLVLATIWVAAANSFFGAAIAALLFSGNTGHAVDLVASALYSFRPGAFAAAFLARMPVNTVDKGIAVGVTYLVLELFKRRDRREPTRSRPELTRAP